MTSGRARPRPRVDPVFRTYLVVQVADWLLLGLLGWAMVQWFEAPLWIPAVILAAWIVKDLLLFPSMRRYYEPEPAERRIVGEEGEALTRIDPHGLARVHGEIWQVHLPRGSDAIARGECVRVRDVDGLHLCVERIDAPGRR